MEKRIEKSLAFVRHIFGSEEITVDGQRYSTYELGLDYLQLLVTRPKERLPVLCLVSGVRQTGKTTFWRWAGEMVGEGPFAFPVDEFIRDRTKERPRLRVYEEITRSQIEDVLMNAACDTYVLKRKGEKARFIENTGAIGVSFNTWDYWVRSPNCWIIKLNQPKDFHPDIFKSLRSEIIDFKINLLQRELVTKKVSRVWFDPRLIDFSAQRELTDLSIMPWGEHHGEKMEDVPAAYLLNLYEMLQSKSCMRMDERAIFNYCIENKDVLEKQAAEEKRKSTSYNSDRPFFGVLLVLAMLLSSLGYGQQDSLSWLDFETNNIKYQIEQLGLSKNDLFPKKDLQSIGKYKVVYSNPKDFKGYYLTYLQPMDMDTLNTAYNRDQYLYSYCDKNGKTQRYYQNVIIVEFLPVRMDTGQILRFNFIK